MNKAIVLSAVLLSSTPALADTLGANPQDAGRVTAVQKGVKEIDVGGMFVYSRNQQGDQATRHVSTLAGIGFQYFTKANVSVGGTVLAAYDSAGPGIYSTGFGGTANATLHIRFGLGLFVRPTIAVGGIFGSQKTEMTAGELMSATQVSGLLRLAIPFAYFASPRIVLQAGPELDVNVGVVTPTAGDAQAFSTVSGGFGVNAGYTF